MIIYQKMSLFDAPEGSILVHACNAQGVWCSGIAAEFKEKYPQAYDDYKSFCFRGGVVGQALLSPKENNRKVCSLITSFSYGKNVDPVKDILDQTWDSINDLLSLHSGKNLVFYSNKFNSGLFKVPWKQTEDILQTFVKTYGIVWIVCDPKWGEYGI